MNKTYTVMLVDDEMPALTNMQVVLADHPQWHLLASCYDTNQARAVLAQQAVDLILLDIEMPKQSGIEFARELCASGTPPLIVFITAYDQHAVSAFDVFALDYLLKPFDDERFAQMLARAAASVALKQQAALGTAMQDYLDDRRAVEQGKAAPSLQYLVIRSVGHSERINIDDVLWFGTAANYVEIHLPHRLVLHRATLSAMEERLPAAQFIRLHRNALVRISAMARLQVLPDGTYQVGLCNGEKLRVSESYLKQVRKLFE